MIAHLRGTIAAILDDAAVVDVGGVGYLVGCAPATLQRLPAIGEAVLLHTELVVREDAMTLYGFLDPGERVWFRLLQTVQGVGARVALSILGVLRPAELVTAIAAGDKAALARASGVGTRLAARVTAELRDRIGGVPTVETSRTISPAAAPGGADDAVSALINLGYGRSDAFTAVTRVSSRHGGGAPVEQLIREGLKELTG